MTRLDGVSIITCTHLPRYMNNIFDNYARQTYPVKELILVLNSSYLNVDDCYRKARSYKNVKIIQRPETDSVGTCLNYAIRESSFPYFSIFDHDDYYGQDYLNDFMSIAPYSNAMAFGKKTHYVYFEDQKTLALIHPGRSNSYVDYIINCTLFGRKEIFNKIKFIDSNVVDEQFGADCNRLGIKLYAIHPYNFAYIRHDDLTLHTYKMENRQLLEQYCEFVAHVDNYRPLVDRKIDYTNHKVLKSAQFPYH